MKQYNVNSVINKTFYKDNKINFLNNSFMDKKSISNRRLNKSYINKKDNNDLSCKKRDAKIKIILQKKFFLKFCI